MLILENHVMVNHVTIFLITRSMVLLQHGMFPSYSGMVPKRELTKLELTKVGLTQESLPIWLYVSCHVMPASRTFPGAQHGGTSRGIPMVQHRVGAYYL